MARKPAAKPKPDKAKKPRKPRKQAAAAAETAQDAPGSVPGHNAYKPDPDKRRLALKHRDTYATLKARLGKVQKDFRLLGKEVKSDGFSMRQIKLMHELSTPEGEEAFRMSTANDLIAAQYAGATIGQQLALFLEPDRTPAVDMAYDEGVQDCMEGKSPKPSYAPSVPQHASYMKGYHDETERRLQKGIKKLEPKDEPEPEADRASTLAAARAANEVPPAEKLN